MTTRKKPLLDSLQLALVRYLDQEYVTSLSADDLKAIFLAYHPSKEEEKEFEAHGKISKARMVRLFTIRWFIRNVPGFYCLFQDMSAVYWRTRPDRCAPFSAEDLTKCFFFLLNTREFGHDALPMNVRVAVDLAEEQGRLHITWKERCDSAAYNEEYQSFLLKHGVSDSLFPTNIFTNVSAVVSLHLLDEIKAEMDRAHRR